VNLISPTNSYDRVPYPSHPFAVSHPDRLATIGTLFGMHPRAPDHCRVLEIGCASGGNIIPMAAALPDSTFLGIDLSQEQIAVGQKVVDSLRLQNIRLEVRDCMDLELGAEKYDYIICHGVFSWVPKPVQDRILALCVESLEAEGIAYISYNTRPGWNMRSTIRDMMRYHTANLSDPETQIEQARAILEFFADSIPTDGNAYGMLLKSELTQLRKQADGYMFHDHLEDVNEPIYFHEFMTRARAAGLDYLGEADLGVMWLGNLAPKTAEVLRGAASNVVKIEQYMDFLRNRMFRRTLLCHAGVKVHRNLSVSGLEHRYLAANLKLLDSPTELKTTSPVRFQHRQQNIISTAAPVTKLALHQLATCWPQSIRFEELARTAVTAIDPQAGADSFQRSPSFTILGNDLLTCCASDQIEISVNPSRFTISVSEYPQASRLACLQATSGNVVTNLRHELVQLDSVDLHLLRLLDGNHSPRDLVAELERLAASGNLTVHAAKQTPGSLRSSLAQAVEDSLERIARRALLIE